jgi:hypothetical protein
MQPFRDLMPKDRDALSVVLDQIFGSRLSPKMRTRLLANDLNALRTLTQDRESNAGVVASMIMPCLLIVGELDPRLVPVRQMCVRTSERSISWFAYGDIATSPLYALKEDLS